MEPLLTTKFFIPPSRRKAILRERLFETLDGGLQNSSSLFLVSAPAGTGKTTLVTSWLRSRGYEQDTVWLSLDEDDDDCSVFWRYFFGAVQRTFPEIAIDPSLIFHPSGKTEDIRSLLALFLNACMQRDSQRPILIVLDDFHVITNPEICEAISFLVVLAPVNFHLILMTRTDPLFPLSRFRLMGTLLELRERDLRFGFEESEQLFSQSLALTLNGDQVKILQERTEGWIAGLLLAGMSLVNRADIDQFIQNFSGDNRYIADYLFEETLSTLSKEQQSFLRETSILQPFNVSLCAVVTGIQAPLVVEYLTMLEHGNFFLIPLDQSREWFRYHHLAADLLRAQLKMSVPDEEIVTLHLRAAEWYRNQGMAEEAIRHAFLADAETLAGEVIAQFIPEALYRYELKTVGRWVKSLSEEVIRHNIDLVIGIAAYYSLLGQPEQIEKYVGWAQELFEIIEYSDTQRLDHLKGQVWALKFQLLVYQEQLLEASKAAETALEMLPQEGVMRLWVLTQLADIYLWVAKVEQAEMAAQQAVAVSQRLHRDIDTITAYVGLAHVFFMQGKLRLEMEYYQKALALDPKIAGEYSPFSCITLIRIASNHRWAHRLEEAYQTALMGVALAERWREGEYLLEAYVELASVLGGMREFERSLETIEKAQKIAGAQSQWFQHQIEHRLMYLKTLQAMDAGLPIDETLEWAQEKLAELTNPVPAANIPMLVVAAMILVAAGEAECSLRIVNMIEEDERIAGRISMLLMIWPIKALACWNLGQSEEAFAVLDEALSTVVTEGSVHHYIDLNEPMHALLKTYANQCRDTRYVSRLLAYFGEKQQSVFHLSEDGLIENLTPREQEVLELIALGFTNQGIAEELYLAETTVKKHVSNIYSKLGVRKRTQAVQRARELKLIK